jgi:hypothetical protein
MKKLLLFLAVMALILNRAASQTAYDANANVAHAYFEFSLKLIKETNGFTPPVASRALGYTGLCLYESVVHGMPDRFSLAGKLPEFASMPQPGNVIYYWPLVANNALSSVMDSLYDNKSLDNRIQLYAIRNNFNVSFSLLLPLDVYQRSVSYGEAVGKAIFAYSKTEAGYRGQYKNFPTAYVPPAGDEYWLPLANQVALQPYWGNNRAFIPDNVSASTLPPPPPTFGNTPGTPFYAYANEVYTTVNNLTQAQKDIATFWADGSGTFTPPGHSISMLRQILIKEGWDLGHSAVAYAELGMALSDAFLACWKTKYIHNLCRPITFIHKFIDPNWNSFIGTPPFPEYPSGHSSQSGAWMVIMTDFFGYDYAFTDSTYAATLGVRSFYDFETCAEETAVSRLYGGIHYDFGNKNGSYLGHSVGYNFIDLFNSLVSGTEERKASLPAVKVFPNPTTGRIFVENSAAKLRSVQVFNLTGSIVRQGVLDGGTTEFDLYGLTSGLYLLHFRGENGESLGQQRVIVQ